MAKKAKRPDKAKPAKKPAAMTFTKALRDAARLYVEETSTKPKAK